MGLGKFVGGVLKIGIAAVAVAGVCSLFKEEIRETETYKKANEKYDVDTKVKKATEVVKSTTMEAAKKVSETAKTVKEKWGTADDESVAENEIILDDAAPEARDYVDISDTAKEAGEKAEDAVAAKAEDAAETVAEAAGTATEDIVLD